MKEIFNKKYTVTCKGMLISSCISSIVLTIVLYIFLSAVNVDTIAKVIEGGNALKISIIVFPIILIVNIMLALLKVVLKGK